MANVLKCPNANCAFLFDPSQVPNGAILSCPQCAMRFTLGPPQPASPPPQLPPGLEETRTLDMPPTAPTIPAQPPSVQTQSRRPSPRRVANESPFPWGTLVGIFAVVGTAIAVGYFLITQMGSGGTTSAVVTFQDRNISYRFPGSTWEKDDEVRTLLSGNLFGLKRADGSAIVALEARDYKTRNPQPGELREGIAERLRSLFEDLDLRELDDTTWAGQPAFRSMIRGNASSKLGSGVYVGEAYAMASKGVAYWFVALAPETQGAGLAAELPDLLERMKLLEVRNAWKESTSATYTLVGREADYRLTDGDGWWKTLSDPKFEDPNADQVFDAEFRFRTKRDFKPRARVTVLLLPATGEPVAAIRNYLKEQYEKQFGLKNWEELTEAPQGDWPPSGEQRGTTTYRYHVTGSDPNTAKLVILSAIKMDVTTSEGRQSRAVGVYAVCPLEHQQYWEKRLIQVATSLRAAGM